jgi:hypothetical protein
VDLNAFLDWKLTVSRSRGLRSWMHLREYVLAGAALQLQNGDVLSLTPSARAHLADCPRCAARLDELQLVLAGERHAAVDAADAVFSDDTLDAQRDAIMTRLIRRHAGARVLMFPSAIVRLPRRDRPAMRWISGTVAAGLLVGVATGQALYTHDVLLQHQAPHRLARQWPNRWVAETGPDAPRLDHSPTDETFLSELESALANRRNPALRALDEMTPRAPGSSPRRPHRER